MHFAPGIPDRTIYGELSDLPTDGLATLVRQLHKARRAGTHTDLRIGTPSGLYSWAVPKGFPEDDKPRLAIRQPLHQWSYKDFQGRIGHGYGTGTVQKLEESPIVLLKNTGDHLLFTRGDSRHAPVYGMVRTKGNDWLLRKLPYKEPQPVAAYRKEHFKMLAPALLAAALTDDMAATPKIDGAGALAYLGDKGIRVFGIRPDAHGNHPEYTDYLEGLRTVQVPRQLRGSLIRGELYGRRPAGPISANELSGILNSNLLKARYKLGSDGIRLLMAATAVGTGDKDNYDPEAVSGAVKAIGTPYIHALPVSRGKQRILELLKQVKAGRHPLTREGIVVTQPGKRPVKVKFRDDHDVVVKDIFKADSKDSRAGGFTYATPSGEGRVGTGFTHAMLKDMLAHPESYIGRTARIQAQEQYGTGAYRAPSFIAFKED